QPFHAHAELGRGEAGGVAARARQTIDNACADRVRDQDEHDRHGARCLLHRPDAVWGGGHDDIGHECDDFLRISTITIGLARRPPHGRLCRRAAARAPPAAPSATCGEAAAPRRTVRGRPPQAAGAPHAPPLLSARRERPSGYTPAEKSDELAPPHGAYPK